jgi:autotransporter-associated beta strand protein/T5SS/PEP-CTERM-associated repeat protein
MRNATMNVGAGATLTTTSTYTSVGLDPGENATLNILSGGTLVAANQDFNIGDNGNATTGSRGTLNLESGSTATINGNFEIGKNQNVVGIVNQKGANVTANRELWVGNNIGGNGTWNQSAGTTTVNNWFAIGRLGATGTVDLSGGTITKAGGGNTYIGESTGAVTSTMTVRGTGSLIINNGELWLGNAGGSKGVLTIKESGLVRVANNWLAIGRNGGSTGTLNLEGGTLEKAGGGNLTIGSGNSTGTLTQTGGTLTSNATFVGEGGSGLMDLRAGTASVGPLIVGRNGAAGGELRVSGSAAVTATTVVMAGAGAVESTPGTINLTGASLTANSIAHGAGTGPATLNLNGGTLKAGLDGANLVSGVNANVLAGGATIDSNGKNVTMSQALAGAAGDGGLTKTGAGTLTASSTGHTYTGATTVSGGTLAVTGSVFNSSGVTVNNTGTFQAAASQRVKTLTVNAGGIAQLPAPEVAGARNVLTVGDGSTSAPLNIVGTGAAAGRVDLDRNGLIVDVAAGAETAALNAVRLAAGNAFHGGLWDQPGLTSGLITASNRLSVGFGLPADVPAVTGGNQFYGSPVDASSIVARVTVGGDATMDSVVNFDDLLALAKSYNRTDAYWAKGDFDYNAIVNFDDLLILAKNYNQVMPSEPIPGATAEFKADMAAAFAAAVPEPTSLALFGLAGAALLGGRRRRAAGK